MNDSHSNKKMYIILQEITAKRFQYAFDLLEEYLDSRELTLFTSILLSYLNSELGNVKEAVDMVKTIGIDSLNEAESCLLLKTFKNLDYFENLSQLSNLKTDIVGIIDVLLLNDQINEAYNYVNAKNVPIEYRIFINLCFCLQNDQKFEYEQYMKECSFIFSSAITSELLYIVLKYKIIDKCRFIELLKKTDHIIPTMSLLIRKEMILNGFFFQIPGKSQDPYSPFNQIPEIKKELNFLISNIDDYQLYKYASDHNIQVESSNSMNYKIYFAIKTNDIEVLVRVIERIPSYFLLNKIIDEYATKAEIDTTSLMNSYSYYIIKYLSNQEINEGDLKDIYKQFNCNETIEWLKLFLAYLISSKRESNLILALFYSREYQSKYESFEIKLIYMFLLRHFYLLDDFSTIFNEFDIKHICLVTFEPVWADLINIFNDNEILKTKIEPFENKYKTTKNETHKNINNILGHFINKSSYYQAYKTLEAKRSLKNQKIIRSNEIFEVLGKRCSWIFDLIHKDNDIETSEYFKTSQIANIYNISNNMTLNTSQITREIDLTFGQMPKGFYGFMADVLDYQSTLLDFIE